MPVHDVDEETQLSSSTFSTLTGRKRPLVLRGAAGDWGASSFFTKKGVGELRTTWRVHPVDARTVWEAECQFLDASVGQFLEWERSDSTGQLEQDNPFAPFDRKGHWAYADYKHVKELAKDWAKALEPLVHWGALGCEKSAEDCTVWLGTRGSHTPLHHDTYGVNMVAQVHGKKKWLLFSPESTPDMYATRVPYEESSVFSRVDARMPDLDRFPQFRDVCPLSVTLEPGDVLYVPKHWWHFVEALDTSLSINVWVDAPDDALDRAKEALARVVVTSLSDSLSAEVGPNWLNPTERAVWPLEETLQVAELAFQGLETSAETQAYDPDDRQDPPSNDFSVRTLIDAITAPDVLNEVVKKLLPRRSMNMTSERTPPPN